MCGFIGCYESSEVPNISEKLRRRGPDDTHSWCDEHLSVSFTRLAITERSMLSRQPSVSSKSILCFNGEIYNFETLSKDPRLNLNTEERKSDTLVLHALLDEYGFDGLRKILGIFAFSYYVKKTSKLYLARDSIGVKPLYYHLGSNGSVKFSSLISDLFSGPRELKNHDISYYLKWQSFNSSVLLGENITEVEPGCVLDVKEQTSIRWYKSNSNIISNVDLEVALSAAINSQCPDDIETAVFLSGGIDSSIIAYELRDRDNVLFVTMGQQDDPSDETNSALRLASDLKLDIRVIRLTPEIITASLDEFFHTSEMPTGDGLNTFLLTKALKKMGIKVGISGAGADEVFGGYSGFDVPRYLIGTKPSYIGPSRLQYKLRSRFNVMDHLDNSAAFFKNFEVPDQQYFNSSHSIYVNVRNFYFEHFLKPTLLRDLDSFSMYNGVEVRVPFLQDNIIVQAEEQYRRHPKDFLNGKKTFLRRAYAKKLPPYIFDRRKTGFGLGLQNALETEQKWLSKAMNELQYFNIGYYNIDVLKNQTLEIYKSKRSKQSFRRLWLFICLMKWLKLYV